MSYRRFKVVLGLGYVENDFYKGVIDFAVENKWRLDNTSFHTGELPDLKDCDGIITMHGYKKEIIQLLKNPPVPLIDAGVAIKGTDNIRVNPDNKEIGRQIANHFIRRGFENFTFIKTNLRSGFENLRLEGFKEVILKSGKKLSIIIDENTHPWQLQFEEFLHTAQLPNALMTSSDVISSQVIDIALKTSVRVPHDLAVIGVKSDSDIHRLAEIPLSHIDSNNYKIGRRAAVLLQELMQNPSNQIAKIHLVQPGKIHVRQSSDILAIPHPQIRQALGYISRNFDKQINATDVLTEIKISPAQGHLLFKRHCHCSILQELTRRRLEKARQLLTSSDIKIKEIAYLSGFSSGLRMNVVFKRELGITPGEFRRESQ